MVDFNDIRVSSFPSVTKEALLKQLFQVSVYPPYIAKLMVEHAGNLPTEVYNDLLRVALAMHIWRPASTITALRRDAELLRSVDVDIFPEIPDLAGFTEGIYSPIKAEATTIFLEHRAATSAALNA